MSERFDMEYALKAMTWERAKGELRALVALRGASSSVERDEDGRYPFERTSMAVEAFINEIEGAGLHE